MNRTATAVTAIGLMGVLAGCADGGASDEASASDAAGTTTTGSTRTVTSTQTQPRIVDADPAEFATAGSPGYYRWTYATGRGCAAAPAMNGMDPAVYCSVTFPAGTPDVKNDVFVGAPNSIRLTAEGTEATIQEGGPPGARTLPVGSRIAIGDNACTALANGITCSSPGGGFTFEGGALTRTGIEIPPTAP
ncbi:hypothetical protein WKY82_13475 [Gordonia malaquae]|jgi:hypothetical protein|uniref:hypothetical protein n=1 Tax=Gordonia TaxID=2053 RepID=UPI003015E0DF